MSERMTFKAPPGASEMAVRFEVLFGNFLTALHKNLGDRLNLMDQQCALGAKSGTTWQSTLPVMVCMAAKGARNGLTALENLCCPEAFEGTALGPLDVDALFDLPRVLANWVVAVSSLLLHLENCRDPNLKKPSDRMIASGARELKKFLAELEGNKH